MPLVRVGHHDDWPTLGWEGIAWIETYLCHGPGDIEGEELILDDEFVQFLLDAYRLYPRDHRRAGQRVVTHGELSRAKGRAKSELAGAVVCLEAKGPARFAGWNAKGEPVGRPVKSPFIRCLATEESQSGNTYDNVTVMLDHAAEHFPEEFGDVDIGKSTQASTRIYLAGGGEIRPSSAANASKDGGKETFAVADEIHLYYLPSLKGMHRTVSRNLRKRKIAEPWMLDTTTAHQPGQESVGESNWNMAQQLLDGRRKLAGGFYLNHREGGPVERWENNDELLASLEEAYGEAATWMDLELILTNDIRAEEATEAASRRYWLNQVRKGAGQYFDPLRWKQLTYGGLVIPDDELVVAGFDGARFEDSTALIVTAVETGHQWVAGLWEKPIDAGEHEWVVPDNEVDDALEELHDTFDVWRVYADPPWWEDTVARWQGKYGEKRIVPWYTQRTKPMVYALSGYRSAQRGGRLTNDGDEGMARHIGNAYRRTTRIRDEHNRPMDSVGKERPDSPNKIDAAVAGTLSWEARNDCITEGMPRSKRKKQQAFFV